MDLRTLNDYEFNNLLIQYGIRKLEYKGMFFVDKIPYGLDIKTTPELLSTTIEINLSYTSDFQQNFVVSELFTHDTGMQLKNSYLLSYKNIQLQIPNEFSVQHLKDIIIIKVNLYNNETIGITDSKGNKKTLLYYKSLSEIIIHKTTNEIKLYYLN